MAFNVEDNQRPLLKAELAKKKALSPNRVVPLDEEGCGKMAKAHTAPGVAGNASFSPTQTGDRAFFILSWFAGLHSDGKRA